MSIEKRCEIVIFSKKAWMSKGQGHSTVLRLTAGGIIGKGLFALSGIIAAKNLGVDAFGVLSFSLMTFALVSQVMGYGISGYVSSLTAKDEGSKSGIIAACLISSLVIGFIGLSACVSFSSLITVLIFGNKDYTWLLIAGAPIVLIGFLEGALQGILSGIGKSSYIVVSSLLSGFLLIILTFVIIIFFKEYSNPLSFLLCNVVSQCVGVLVLFRIVLDLVPRFAGWGIPSVAHFKEIAIKYTIPLMMSGIVIAPVRWILQAIIVGGQDGLREISGIAIATQIQGLINIYIFSIRHDLRRGFALSDNVVAGPDPSVRKLINLYSRRVSLLCLLCLVTSPVVFLFLGNGYDSYYIPAAVMILSSLCFFWFVMLSDWAVALRRTRLLPYANIIIATVQISIVALVPSAVGFSAGVFLGYLVAAVYLWWGLK